MKKVIAVLAVLALIVAVGAYVSKEEGRDERVLAGIIDVDASSLFSGEAMAAPGPQDASGAATLDEQLAGSSSDQPEALSQSVPQTKLVTQDMKGYENRAFRFGLLFPKNLNATEYREQGNALSVTFQDPDTNEGFQIYVTPYNKKVIDTERFKLDQPSGVFKEPKEVMVGGGSTSLTTGVRGTMFFGHNPIMGETREVWFIKNGYLYEVSTYKELDSWLGGIMQTWKFL